MNLNKLLFFALIICINGIDAKNIKELPKKDPKFEQKASEVKLKINKQAEAKKTTSNIKSLHKLNNNNDINGTYDKYVIKSKKPVIVKFTATWCGPCQELSKVLKPIAKKHAAKFDVIEVDIDECNEISNRFEIQSVPHLFFYKNGKKVGELIGFLDAEDVEKAIKKYLKI